MSHHPPTGDGSAVGDVEGGTAPSTSAETATLGGSGKRGGPVGKVILGVIAAATIIPASIFSIQAAGAGSDLRSSMTYIAPAGVGGGWDSFAREQQQALRTAGIVNNVQVVNIPGAGGTIGLSSFATMDGQATTVMATGAAMTGGIALNDSATTLEDVVPIARIAEDYNAFIVPADSPYNSMDELVEAFRNDPSSIVWSGGSAGSMDHLMIAQLALDQGIDPEQIRYIPKSGGGEAVQSMLAGTTDVTVTGFNEVSDQIEAGRVKGLAVTSPERFEGFDLPTISELGYGVDLVNWRGVMAAPGISEDDVAELEAIFTEMKDSPEWQDALERNRWQDSFLTGEEFEEFLREDQERAEQLVEELGL